ncbi:hypothetical protein Drose_26050 [Dactylosporangium roseum]|uniref:Resolvase/invertase-type recombinase catalytic domain-containing protein n=1 Tax=Dactylosporangium roseum TaxID=47989 RepID=A0ABY5YYS4_9ACTN|nr:hypothetical protein [Dactylosporangium roseum]UWZ34667.1 hypothetical protein Drose_26050 [Dactylosporangium roseum]
MSGRFGSERDGYREIVARMCMGEVGAVFGLEVSWFGRFNADLSRLMEFARLADTLLIDVDGVYDLANVNDPILLGLGGAVTASGQTAWTASGVVDRSPLGGGREPL